MLTVSLDSTQPEPIYLLLTLNLVFHAESPGPDNDFRSVNMLWMLANAAATVSQAKVF